MNQEINRKVEEYINGIEKLLKELKALIIFKKECKTCYYEHYSIYQNPCCHCGELEQWKSKELEL